MKALSCIYLLLTACCLYADVPGNKPRASYDVTLTGLQQFPDYTFFAKGYDQAYIIKDSAVIHIAGGFGAPRCTEIWAVNIKTNSHTDTLYFCGGDEKKSMKIILHISNNHLGFGKIIATKKIINDSQNINIVGDIYSNRDRIFMYLISACSFVGLIVMTFFVWKKNKENSLQKSI